MTALTFAYSLTHKLVAATAPLGAIDWACLIAAVLIQRLASALGMWPYALVALPGTLVHELAHFLVALLLQAEPTMPSIIPQRTPHGWRLGSVRFHGNFLVAAPIALAPFVLTPLALWIAVHTMAWHRIDWIYALWTWICASLLSASLPSRQDWRVAAPFLIAAVVAVITYYLVWGSRP